MGIGAELQVHTRNEDIFKMSSRASLRTHRNTRPWDREHFQDLLSAFNEYTVFMTGPTKERTNSSDGMKLLAN